MDCEPRGLGSHGTMKKKFFVGYNYGQGQLMAFMYAESPEEIMAKYRDLEVVSEGCPPWLTLENQRTMKTCDVDQPESWLKQFRK